MSKNNHHQDWPELNFQEFAETNHLLHMGLQAIGKLKLLTPFEPEWANVPLWVTSRGLTTGPIPYNSNIFNVDVDFVDNKISCETSAGNSESFKLASMSVADLYAKLFNTLHSLDLDIKINPKPQEIPNPINFDQDTKQCHYDADMANAWWRILFSAQCVMQQYHSHFRGKTQPIGLMWGTLDLRDVRYKGTPLPPDSKMDFIRRNAMDEPLVEVGWWAGNERYNKPAFFSFTYPAPKGIEKAKISPSKARWDMKLQEFIYDYDEMRKSKDSQSDLLNFFDSTYAAGAKLAGWDPNLVGSGKPV